MLQSCDAGRGRDGTRSARRGRYRADHDGNCRTSHWSTRDDNSGVRHWWFVRPPVSGDEAWWVTGDTRRRSDGPQEPGSIGRYGPTTGIRSSFVPLGHRQRVLGWPCTAFRCQGCKCGRVSTCRRRIQSCESSPCRGATGSDVSGQDSLCSDRYAGLALKPHQRFVESADSFAGLHASLIVLGSPDANEAAGGRLACRCQCGSGRESA